MSRWNIFIVVSGILFAVAAQAEVQPNTRAGYKAPYSSNRGQTLYPGQYYYGTPTAPHFFQPNFFAPPPISHSAIRQVAVQPKFAPVPPAPPVENTVNTDTPVNSVVPPPPVVLEKNVERTIIIRGEEPKDNVEAELDALNARLAKIQLERHNLADTLALLKKIKSTNFLALTLVDLAEYVSRDKNYKAESDALYSLSTVAIEAVRNNKPISLDVPVEETPKKTIPVAAEEPDPVPPDDPPAVPDVPTEPPKKKIPVPMEDPDDEPIPPPRPPNTDTPPKIQESPPSDADKQKPDGNVQAPPAKPSSPHPDESPLTQITPLPPIKKPEPAISLDDDSETPIPPATAPVKPVEEPKTPTRKPLPTKKIILEEN